MKVSDNHIHALNSMFFLCSCFLAEQHLRKYRIKLTQVAKMPKKPKVLTESNSKLQLFKILRSLKPNQREYLIGELGEDAINTISESIWNLRFAKLGLSKQAKKKVINEWERNPLLMSYICNPKRPWKKRQKRLPQLGSGNKINFICQERSLNHIIKPS